MPMSQAFEDRLNGVLEEVAAHFGTPFHIYDEVGIRQTGQRLRDAFADVAGFQEFFAVKALPNRRILEIFKEMGFGFDCSSVAELVLARQVGATPDEIMFTSNNTSPEEFEAALAEGGCILNLDDISLTDKVPQMPKRLCFRYNPGARRTGNHIIGTPEEAKYGVSHAQIQQAYVAARERGVERFGLHTMLASNELDYRYMVDTTAMLLDLAGELTETLQIQFEFINIGGGVGIAYQPDQASFDIQGLGDEAAVLLDRFAQKRGYRPDLHMESGRYMTGPHGCLVATAINRKETYRTYVGLDACMSSLMRPALYGVYHHISVPAKADLTQLETVDVVGSLCENNDKFAVQRELPAIADGDRVVIHDTGAHGQAMGFNYNGRLRPQELLLRADGQVELIRRAETLEDHFATFNFEPHLLAL